MLQAAVYSVQMLFKKGVFKNITVNISLRTCNFIKKRLQHRRSSVKTVKFLRTPFLTELHWLLLSGTGYTVVATWHRSKKHDVLRNSEYSIPTFLTKILVANRFLKNRFNNMQFSENFSSWWMVFCILIITLQMEMYIQIMEDLMLAFRS